MKINYTFTSTDGSKCEIVTISKDVLKNCTMSAEGFEQLFFDQVRVSTTYVEAYEKAEEEHERVFEKRRYSDYNSFRNCKTQKMKK